jgi:hypothetical protein
MNKLSLAKRVQILSMLCEGSSMRSISRVCDVSINTVTKLLVDAGETCLALHDELVRNVRASRIQCDEIWSFCYARAFSDQVAYPAFLKRFRHSSGLYRSMMRPIAVQSPSRVRSSAFRSKVLSLAKACSMGLRSGL